MTFTVHNTIFCIKKIFYTGQKQLGDIIHKSDLLCFISFNGFGVHGRETTSLFFSMEMIFDNEDYFNYMCELSVSDVMTKVQIWNTACFTFP